MKSDQICEAIAARLASVVPSVFINRKLSYEQDELPAICVRWTGNRAGTGNGQFTSMIEQSEQVQVEIYLTGRDAHEPASSGEDTAQAQLAVLRESVEAILVRNLETLGGLIFRLVYTGAQLNENPEGSLKYVMCVLTFDAVWHRVL